MAEEMDDLTRKYLDSDGDNCPRCGSDDLDKGTVDVGSVPYQGAWCNNCQSSWSVEFAMSRVYGFEPGDAGDEPVKRVLDMHRSNDYVNSRGQRCVTCQSEDILPVSAFKRDGNCVTQRVRCGDCASTWTDRYVLTRPMEVEIHEPSALDHQKLRVLNGYDLFEVEGKYQIQRLDYPDDDERLLGVTVKVRHESDFDAIQWVQTLAQAGDLVAKDALEKDGQPVDGNG